MVDGGWDIAPSFLGSAQSMEPEILDPGEFSLQTFADPSAGIELIQYPDVDEQGTAHLHFPITLPPGRKDMTPDLNITYTSEFQNGWMGWGWDLAIPTIEIDTRWGVPRFDSQEETETYLFNGEQLTPVTHRGQLQPRTAEKFFIPGWKPTFCVSFAMATTRITTGGKFGIMMDPDSVMVARMEVRPCLMIRAGKYDGLCRRYVMPIEIPSGLNTNKHPMWV